jgi:tetratricopeptide (TPR) repeat protein
MTAPSPDDSRRTRFRLGVLAAALVLLAVAAVAVAAGGAWRGLGRSVDAETMTTGGLAKAAWEAVDRQDTAAARKAIRSLKDRGALGLAGVVQARLLVARGFSRPALDLLASLPAEALVADDADLLRFVHLVRGEAAYRLRLYPLAERELSAVLAATPDSVDAHRLLAAMTYDAGVIPAAIEHLEATARLAPDDPRPQRLLGLIHNDYERYPEAVEHYEESLRRSPDQADRDGVLVELAGSLVKLHRHREALATLDKVSGVSDAADILRAESLLAIGDRAAARGIVKGILETSPDDLGAIVLEGSIDLEDGKPEAALGVLERGVAKHPKDYLARLKLAQAYAGCGREAEAEAARVEAERIRALRRMFADLHQEAWARPGDADVRRRLATMAADLDRPDLEGVWLEAAAAVEAGRKPAENRE